MFMVEVESMTDYQQQINILIAETLDQFGSVPVHKVAQDLTQTPC
jgi:hypothetical protein